MADKCTGNTVPLSAYYLLLTGDVLYFGSLFWMCGNLRGCITTYELPYQLRINYVARSIICLCFVR